MCEEGSWQQIELAQENGDYKKMAALLLPLAEMAMQKHNTVLANFIIMETVSSRVKLKR